MLYDMDLWNEVFLNYSETFILIPNERKKKQLARNGYN